MSVDVPAPEVTPAAPPASSRAHRLFAALTEERTATVTFLAIVLGVLVGGIVVAFSDPTVLPKYSYFFARPMDALSATWQSAAAAYSALFKGAVVDPAAVSAYLHGTGSLSNVFYPLSETLVRATPLICSGLGVTLAFRTGLFNIGGQGQILWGALFAGIVGFQWHLPGTLHFIVAMIAGCIGGALWASIAGVLKARTGAHEVISTIMLNYIALYLMYFLLSQHWLQMPGRTDPISPLIDGNAHFPRIAGPSLRLHLGFVIALLAAVAVWWLLERSTLGFQLRAVGTNPDAARTAGMSIPRSIIIAMALAGLLCGLAGAQQMLGTEFQMTPTIAATYGIDAITVALLGRATPLGTVLAAILIGGLQSGAAAMQASTGVPEELVTVIQALIVLFIAAPLFVRALFRLRPRDNNTASALSRGW